MKRIRCEGVGDNDGFFELSLNDQPARGDVLYISEFKQSFEAEGTSLRAHAVINKEEALKLFGTPHIQNDTWTKWVFKAKGEVVTCYYRADQRHIMHIGGNNNVAGWLVALLFDLKASEWVIHENLYCGSGNNEPAKMWDKLAAY